MIALLAVRTCVGVDSCVCSANCRLELHYGMQHKVGASRQCSVLHCTSSRLNDWYVHCAAMIPLMMQSGYKAKGWLGLILGQSVYYAFYHDAVPTDEKFMQQMDSLTRGTLHHSLPAVGVPVSDSMM